MLVPSRNPGVRFPTKRLVIFKAHYLCGEIGNHKTLRRFSPRFDSWWRYQLHTAHGSAWCGRYPVTVDIDRFETDMSRQFYAFVTQRQSVRLLTGRSRFQNSPSAPVLDNRRMRVITFYEPPLIHFCCLTPSEHMQTCKRLIIVR